MLNIQFFKRRGRLSLGVAVATAALTLAACGSSNNDTGATVPQGGDNSTPPVVADSFINIVKGLFSATNETAEPVSIDGVTASAPETTAPEPTT
ncbi:hypothetical protein [Massilia sp. S19_KUP03_FR1]|uniref:hypothetical protein n=1 Tax=Massilia sp. S19_KUP03_FR1 TaxID=3025503 RepID=UPI002FCDDFA3